MNYYFFLSAHNKNADKTKEDTEQLKDIQNK